MAERKPGGLAETLRWRDNRLELLDQRILPNRVEFVACDSAATTADAIRAMVVRGAPAIGCAAAYGVALEAQRFLRATPAELKAGLEAGFAVLAASRPTAVNLFWALARMRETWQRAEAQHRAVAPTLLAEAQVIHAEDIATNRRMGAHGAALLPDTACVLTHCNAGALATAGHGTALGVIRSAVEAGKKIAVIADETRPFLQGARLTAWELQQDGIAVTLIADVAAASLLARGEVDAIIVGADRVAANGDVANKVGTYPLAVMAQRHAVPFYVAAPCSTIDPSIASGAAIPIEERGREEVAGYGTERWAPEDVPVRNPVFDVTPAALVTALITERGVARAPYAAAITRLLAGK